MERLIKDAAQMKDVQKELGVSVDASSMSFDNIVNAISVMQSSMGVAGATAKEAGTTIQGSVSSMKAAWTNLVAGFADPNADIGLMMENLVTAIVGDGTDSNLGVIGNLIPGVERALVGIGTALEKLVPIVVETLPGLIQQLLPSLLSSVLTLIQGISSALPTLIRTLITPENIKMIVNVAIELIGALIDGLLSVDWLGVAVSIVEALIDGLVSAWNAITDWVGNAWDSLWGGGGNEVEVTANTSGDPSTVIDGSHRSGLYRVPYDGYLAELHKGERVLTAREAEQYGAGETVVNEIVVNINGANIQSDERLAEMIAQKLQVLTDRRSAVYA